MAEPRDPSDTNRAQTEHPDNPPNSVLNRPARRAALWSYLGPVVVLFIVVGLGLAYWSLRGQATPERPDRDRAIGTSGETTPGGGDPQKQPSSTAEELELRGGVKDPAQGPMPALRDKTPLTKLSDVVHKPANVAGRPVDLEDVMVDSAQGNTFWIRDGDDKVAVVAPQGSAPQNGARVHVIGTVEAAGNATRIVASKVESK